ncbi:TetR/AcrR family transcriptional regulator [Pseudonocardia sp. RS11V-5]|uniref:TetR/AcrR family transcriptional regulator n=1 Tax=Pseudonocardia terrae TaxID=2905831 RepID=UPI001E43F7EB|nr:TetR/AcrR family transcriptional regulator [Pseudonocardia terrae]MCE3553709.1 TetR/AcrR family transcriptional regulator [Pseudonocardia terrae]
MTERRPGRREERNAETRRAILRAAEELFSAQGWQGTRITEVAARAGVATATCYNHFGSKHALIGHLFAPRIAEAVARVKDRIVAGAQAHEIVRVAVGEMVLMLTARRTLTFALFAALQEDAIRSDGPPHGPDDVRVIAQIPLILETALRHASDVLGLDLDADRTARYHTNALLLQVLTRPDSTAGDLRDFTLLQLRGALVPPYEETSEEAEVLRVEAP